MNALDTAQLIALAGALGWASGVRLYLVVLLTGLAGFQKSRDTYSDLKMNMPIYEMITTDDGQQWVHRWLKWEGTLKNGKSVAWPSHASFLVSDGKIRGAGYIFNALPGYLANQPDSTATK